MKAKYSLSTLIAAGAFLALCLTVHASDMDRRIEVSAQQSYVFKTYLQGDDVRIQSKKGAVTLTGIVNENFHKALAQETVSALPGVKNVENRLEIKGASPTPNSDAWLRDKVKVALMFHRKLNAGTTEIDVKEGIVTLRGVAANQTQKDLTTEHAKDAEGVKDVINEMTVSQTSRQPRRTGEKIDDASITAQVNMTLLNHRSTSVLNTTVKTRRGVVTVGGKTRTAAEKALVTKLVTEIHGVKGIKNLMTRSSPVSGPR